MPAYTAKVKNGAFAAHVECDDFVDLARDPKVCAELQTLLDRHLVLHVSPQKDLNHEAIGRFAISLGMPPGAPYRPASTRYGDAQPAAPARAPMSAEYPFIGDLSNRAREPVAGERVPSYIESLHYDGISAYSVQATFNTPLTTPNMWSDMRAAYQQLPRDLKKVVDERHALHAFIPPPGTALKDFPPLDSAQAKRRPLRIKHPRTNDPLLYLPKNPASIIEGLPADEGIAILHDLWARVNTSPARYTARAAHNQMFVWDGLGTTHTNPAYPRDKPRTLWFFTIPGKWSEVTALA